MEFIQNWILPLITLIGVVVTAAIALTRKDSKLHESISVLNTHLEYQKAELKEIKTNHLKHIEDKVDSLFGKVATIDKDLASHINKGK